MDRTTALNSGEWLAGWAYTALAVPAFAAARLRMVWQSRSDPLYRERARASWAPPAWPFDAPPDLWIHAVSVGEFLAVRPLLVRLAARGLRYLVTTTTPTGAQEARAFLQAHPGCGVHAYLAPDWPWLQRRWLRCLRPGALVLVETELWPNLIRQAAKQGVPVWVINARLSRRSARRYARTGVLTGPMLRSLTGVIARTPMDARRFRALGVPPERVPASGDIKLDLHLSDAVRERAERLRQTFGQRPVLVLASTHEGEDATLLARAVMLRQQIPALLCVAVPRHPHRGERIVTMGRVFGLVGALSSCRPPRGEDSLWVVDEIGVLLPLYGAASVVWLGGSWVARGGHNPVEPLLWGAPVVTGPHVFNFSWLMSALERAGMLMIERDPDASDGFGATSRWLREESQSDRQLRAARMESFLAPHRNVLDTIEMLLTDSTPTTRAREK